MWVEYEEDAYLAVSGGTGAQFLEGLDAGTRYLADQWPT
ncbi:hypothetical protein BPSOL_1560 [Bifidobacterium pseudolongum]|nr:hypothetical protein BPSOL_1560 [Bifidobacterium pseudolongum]